MTPAALKTARETLGLSQAGLAHLLGMDSDAPDRTVRRWELGERRVPDTVETLLWLLDQVPQARALLEQRARDRRA